MFVLDHVSITVRDLNRVRAFYDAIFGALGIAKAYERVDAIGYGQRNRANEDTHSYVSIFESPEAVPALQTALEHGWAIRLMPPRLASPSAATAAITGSHPTGSGQTAPPTALAVDRSSDTLD